MNKIIKPKQKAEELFIEFNKKGLNQISSIINRVVRKQIIKQCVIIAIDEIILSHNKGENGIDIELFSYWQDVKIEIINL